MSSVITIVCHGGKALAEYAEAIQYYAEHLDTTGKIADSGSYKQLKLNV
jgi:hypothetical protein